MAHWLLVGSLEYGSDSLMQLFMPREGHFQICFAQAHLVLWPSADKHR